MNDIPTIQDHALENMPDAENLILEDTLWWMRGRKAIIKEYLERATQHGAISNIMDIGCGSGGNLEVLRDFGSVFGVEPSETLARRARSRGIAETIFEQDVLQRDEIRNMQLLTMFDVLEHIEDDEAFLTQLQQNAAPGHRLLVSVPAGPFLYSEHDRILHHYRRYTNKMLRSTLEKSGYQVLHSSYFMSILFPLALLARVKEKLMTGLGKKSTTVELGALPPILSIPFETTLKTEAILSRKLRFPLGLWLFALAIKKMP